MSFTRNKPRALPPDAAQLGAVVMAINDVVQDLENQLPQLAVLHQGDGEERVEEGRRQRRRHRLGLEAGGYLGGGSESTEERCIQSKPTLFK